MARQLERKIVMMKSAQPVDESSQAQIKELEQTDPNLVEDLLLKKKWNNAQKNPERSMRNQSIDNTTYWQSLNNLPSKSIDNIVTNKIL